MLFQAHHSHALDEIPPPHASILRECLSFTPAMKTRLEPLDATALDERSREIERLKMYRPGEAAQQAESWLREALHQARRSLDGEEEIRRFCSALSTWGAIQRNLGQTSDAARAQLHVLRILRPQPCSTEAGFVLHRLAFVLGDLGDVAGGLISAHQAVAVHQLTPGGERNSAIATAGLAAFHCFYRHAFQAARAAYCGALERLDPAEDAVFTVGARHGLAYSYLMEGRTAEARERLEMLRTSRLEPDQALRLDWMEAEIDAAEQKIDEALDRYAKLLPLAVELMEPSGPVLLALDASALLLESGLSAEAARWHRWLEPIAQKLYAVERAALEPYLDALAAFELERELLDRTAVAFKKANNRMLLGMGRPRAAGRPDLMGRLAA